MSLPDLITHIIIEDKNRKKSATTRTKAMSAKANTVQDKPFHKRPRANLVEGDDIIVAVISQVNVVTNVNKWLVDSGATRHICANKRMFTSYIVMGDGEE
ncbi:hypothetical protein JHK82_022918 [Glycine max]|nr:hypothetical protein JHK85_023429 [Glycine max]KAG5027048.1 hypothetical protein JHK86_022962 [Glycine max]KAG5138187.1 hypothetical protein JHK82_022918 [Glycine max]